MYRMKLDKCLPFADAGETDDHADDDLWTCLRRALCFCDWRKNDDVVRDCSEPCADPPRPVDAHNARNHRKCL